MTDQPSGNESPDSPPAREPVEAVADLCRTLLSLMGLELTVEARMDGSATVLNLTGPDRPLLLSGTAALLNSLEYLMNKAFRSSKEDGFEAIVLDSDDYRKHREAELVLLAQMASEKVLAQRRPLNLQPMTPKERRIIHLALSGTEGIRTESAGEGENRSITIFPS